MGITTPLVCNLYAIQYSLPTKLYNIVITYSLRVFNALDCFMSRNSNRGVNVLSQKEEGKERERVIRQTSVYELRLELTKLMDVLIG